MTIHKAIKKTGLIMLSALLILSGCAGANDPVAVPTLARISVGGTATDIPLDLYSDYIRVRGALSAADGKEDLIAVAGLLHDLSDTDYAPDMEQFKTDTAAYIDSSIKPDTTYMTRLNMVADVLGVTEEAIMDILAFDLLSQYLSSNMFDKIWADMPDDDFIDDTLSEDAQKNNKYEACLEVFYAYLDTLPERVTPTEDPAVYLVDGESLALPGDAEGYIAYCRYLAHIETIYEIMEITAFVADMQNYGAAFDEEAIGAEADGRIAELYEEAAMTDWLAEAYADTGITQERFEASYRAMQVLDIKFAGCSDAYAACYEDRDESLSDLDQSSFYVELMARLMENSEIVSIEALMPEDAA